MTADWEGLNNVGTLRAPERAQDVVFIHLAGQRQNVTGLAPKIRAEQSYRGDVDLNEHIIGELGDGRWG